MKPKNAAVIETRLEVRCDGVVVGILNLDGNDKLQSGARSLHPVVVLMCLREYTREMAQWGSFAYRGREFYFVVQGLQESLKRAV